MLITGPPAGLTQLGLGYVPTFPEGLGDGEGVG